MARNWVRNPFIVFLPFLLFYSLIILAFSRDTLSVDEPSYISFAQNLLEGYYSPPPPEIDLWHGPGYPILIAPFVAIQAPLLVIRLLNAVLLYFSLILFYKLIFRFSDVRKALIFSALFGCYWLAYKGLPVIMTETFVFFLVMLVAFLSEKYFRSNGYINGWLLPLALSVAFLALTKVLFGYVLVAAIVVSLILLMIHRRRNFGKASVVLALALTCCTPYLAYTYSLTGRTFYWSNSGGSAFYWLTNPYSGEYGDWFNSKLEPNESIDGHHPDAREKIKKNHGKALSAILHKSGVAQDDAFKQAAIENIRSRPLKFLQNWLANISRLLFNFPFSYRQAGLGLLINALPNVFLLIAIAQYVPATKRNWVVIPAFIKFVMLIALIYFCLSTFFSAAIRMFYVLFPALAVWIAYVHSINRDSNN